MRDREEDDWVVLLPSLSLLLGDKDATACAALVNMLRSTLKAGVGFFRLQVKIVSGCKHNDHKEKRKRNN